MTPGKRKRSAREKSVESGEVQLPIHTIHSRGILKSLPFQVLSSGRSRTVSLGEEGAAGLERMEMEEVLNFLNFYKGKVRDNFF